MYSFSRITKVLTFAVISCTIVSCFSLSRTTSKRVDHEAIEAKDHLNHVAQLLSSAKEKNHDDSIAKDLAISLTEIGKAQKKLSKTIINEETRTEANTSSSTFNLGLSRAIKPILILSFFSSLIVVFSWYIKARK